MIIDIDMELHCERSNKSGVSFHILVKKKKCLFLDISFLTCGMGL